MLVDQRHVTNVDLNDGKARDFVLVKDGTRYKLCIVARDEVVNIYLAQHDFYKLRQQVNGECCETTPRSTVVSLEPTDTVRDVTFVTETCEMPSVMLEPYAVRWSTKDWLAFN
jgi:hypothetical protein